MILVIGYGNPLRSDDSIGKLIAQIMEERLSHESLQVITAYQLTPELVEPICKAQLVIFIDARVGTRPGEVISEIVEPEKGTCSFTHHVSPGILLGAAYELYGATPVGVLISIVGAAFDYGSDLSTQLSELLPTIADQTESIIRANISVAV